MYLVFSVFFILKVSDKLFILLLFNETPDGKDQYGYPENQERSSKDKIEVHLLHNLVNASPLGVVCPAAFILHKAER